jgi:hypothetical protein
MGISAAVATRWSAVATSWSVVRFLRGLFAAAQTASATERRRLAAVLVKPEPLPPDGAPWLSELVAMTPLVPGDPPGPPLDAIATRRGRRRIIALLDQRQDARARTLATCDPARARVRVHADRALCAFGDLPDDKVAVIELRLDSDRPWREQHWRINDVRIMPRDKHDSFGAAQTFPLDGTLSDTA